MTAASSARVARRLGKLANVKRGDALVTAAATLVARAEADHTVTGATLFMPDGTCRYWSVSDARAIVGRGELAGHA